MSNCSLSSKFFTYPPRLSFSLSDNLKKEPYILVPSIQSTRRIV